MPEPEARAAFLRWRWPDGVVRCPKCAGVDLYTITQGPRWRCKPCHHDFSLTSGTPFASKKVSFAKVMGAIAAIERGDCMLTVSREIGVSYKVVLVWGKKLRLVAAGEDWRGAVGYWQRQERDPKRKAPPRGGAGRSLATMSYDIADLDLPNRLDCRSVIER